MPDKDELKVQKKLAKVEAKTAKKSPPAVEQMVLPVSETGDKTSAERSAEAAEKQLALHRWKVLFAAVSALVALVSLIVLLMRN